MTKFNFFPAFWRRIDDEEFSRAFFQFIFKPDEYRQMMYREENGDRLQMVEGKLYEFAYKGWEGLGVAITHEYVKTKKGMKWMIRFYKFGDPEIWKIKTQEFAAQFRGDNS